MTCWYAAQEELCELKLLMTYAWYTPTLVVDDFEDDSDDASVDDVKERQKTGGVCAGWAEKNATMTNVNWQL